MVTWLKRISFFMLTNIAIIVMVSIITRFLGLERYYTAYGINYQSLLAFCLVWGMVGSFVSLALSKFMAKMFYGVKVVDPNDHQFAGLVNTVHNLARSAGLNKMPEVGIYQSPDLNAFATGPTKNSSLVAVSTGLLEHMNSSELEGVLAHEVSHIANGDMVTMTLIQGVVNAFVMFFARVAAFLVVQALRGERDRNSMGSGFLHFGLVIVFQILFGILGMMVTGFFSRWREFRADNGGAKLAGKEKMVAALQSLQKHYAYATQVRQKSRHSNDSFQALKISSTNSWLQLLSTHPPLDKRIQVLQSTPL
ncbi:MAG: protease HtpX [Halobacteriovoraceae bacterium]|nr:protease HtpX [Halobacteriovoraceae bacterium]MCB9093562.1 protease HtpX [Halobacteriovoraceae bacterium]